MKKIIISAMAILLCISVLNSTETKTKTAPKKKGMISKIGDAATRGYGWQLGKEAAKSTVEGVKKAANSETATKIKEKTKSAAKKVKDKVTDGAK